MLNIRIGYTTQQYVYLLKVYFILTKMLTHNLQGVENQLVKLTGLYL